MRFWCRVERRPYDLFFLIRDRDADSLIPQQLSFFFFCYSPDELLNDHVAFFPFLCFSFAFCVLFFSYSPSVCTMYSISLFTLVYNTWLLYILSSVLPSFQKSHVLVRVVQIDRMANIRLLISVIGTESADLGTKDMYLTHEDQRCRVPIMQTCVSAVPESIYEAATIPVFRILYRKFLATVIIALPGPYQPFHSLYLQEHG